MFEEFSKVCCLHRELSRFSINTCHETMRVVVMLLKFTRVFQANRLEAF